MLQHLFFYCSKKKSQFWINSIVLKNQIKNNHDTLQSRFCIDNHCLTIHDGALSKIILNLQLNFQFIMFASMYCISKVKRF